jgi:hypothetical protein
MANRFYSPNQQFCDTTGAPYAGGSLAFYASGTSTPLATYSDSALTIANTNPVVLDSAGRAGNVFLQNLAYKVVLSDVNSNVIWTDDPVYSSDYSARAKFLSGAGSPNGTTAGTAGSTGIGADSYWDTTNNILYICTVTGTTTTAVWTAVNASTAAAVVPPPAGYLTLTSGTPVTNTDVTAATSIYYTPYTGNLVPIYNGSSFVPTVFTELTLTLSSSHVASNIYDVFVFNNSGVVTLVTGPTWSAGTAGSITAGACARGTGAGGTALSRINGLLTNSVQITGRNGATTYTISSGLATYLGSIYMDGTNGQISNYVSWGNTRKWGVWNAYNRQQLQIKGGQAGSWSYAVSAWRQANGNSLSSVYIFSGLAEEAFDLTAYAEVSSSFSGGAVAGTGGGAVSIGMNNSTPLGSTNQNQFSNSGAAAAAAFSTAYGLTAKHSQPPILGINQVLLLENGLGATALTNTWSGAEVTHGVYARWRG